MYYIYKIEYINDSQYGFTPQKSTIDAAMAVKQFIEPEFEKGKVVIMASLDGKGVFDAAWWPAILKGLRDAQCPQNLYQLTQDYLRERRAVISLNSSTIEKNITKGGPQGSCCGPGLWNIQYNSSHIEIHKSYESSSICGRLCNYDKGRMNTRSRVH
jgi:hypothetical protein